MSQVNLNNMLCLAVSDPFRGKFYRLFAIGHQLVLIPLLGKAFVLLARALNLVARGSPFDCEHAVQVIRSEDCGDECTSACSSPCLPPPSCPPSCPPSPPCCRDPASKCCPLTPCPRSPSVSCYSTPCPSPPKRAGATAACFESETSCEEGDRGLCVCRRCCERRACERMASLCGDGGGGGGCRQDLCWSNQAGERGGGPQQGEGEGGGRGGGGGGGKDVKGEAGQREGVGEEEKEEDQGAGDSGFLGDVTAGTSRETVAPATTTATSVSGSSTWTGHCEVGSGGHGYRGVACEGRGHRGAGADASQPYRRVSGYEPSHRGGSQGHRASAVASEGNGYGSRAGSQETRFYQSAHRRCCNCREYTSNAARDKSSSNSSGLPHHDQGHGQHQHPECQREEKVTRKHEEEVVPAPAVRHIHNGQMVGVGEAGPDRNGGGGGGQARHRKGENSAQGRLGGVTVELENGSQKREEGLKVQ